jgi:hypothetical protein
MIGEAPPFRPNVCLVKGSFDPYSTSQYDGFRTWRHELLSSSSHFIQAASSTQNSGSVKVADMKLVDSFKTNDILFDVYNLELQMWYCK